MREKECILGRMRDVKVAIGSEQGVILLLYTEIYLTKEVISSLLKSVLSILQEFQDILSDELSSGLLLVRGIEHQIDFIPKSTIPN